MDVEEVGNRLKEILANLSPQHVIEVWEAATNTELVYEGDGFYKEIDPS